MVRKKLDPRVATLMQETIESKTRSFFVIVGDKGRDLVCKLQYLHGKLVGGGTKRQNVLWCYNKELGFSPNRKRRMNSIQSKLKSGVLAANEEDPFEVFISSHDIKFCYYNDTSRILGSTQQLLVLQDFEAITPNLLARTIETVQGGGMVVLLLKSMSSLKEIYSPDYSQYPSKSNSMASVCRFNERFVLSLRTCGSCLVVDDELNVLQAGGYALGAVAKAVASYETVNGETKTEEDKELARLVDRLSETQPVGSLVGACKTLDQAQSVLTFVDAITTKTLRGTVSLTAARGRGKSAACGLSISAAVAYGYANIFVTAPAADNLRTVFEFVLKGFDALGYEEHIDYELVLRKEDSAYNQAVPSTLGKDDSETTVSKTGNKNGARPVIVRINIFRQHRQTIQYILPTDAAKLGQAELVVIDEAAAIPLPTVRSLLGNHLTFLSSTIHGYEGTGRALATKLLTELRAKAASSTTSTTTTTTSASSLSEMALTTPIRYTAGDCVEDWLGRVLLLDADCKLALDAAAPHPDRCDAYFVDRTSLFSFHASSELFLSKLVALFVASHYKNSPNDLQLLSDAPGHRIVVLLGPLTASSDALPEILAVAQLSVEGELAKHAVLDALARGRAASGDLIPWTMAQHFHDPDFARLGGVRVVRIATHPSYQRMHYATRLLTLITDFYAGKIVPMHESPHSAPDGPSETSAYPPSDDTLLTESLVPRSELPPLLSTLAENTPERVHYLGVAYGLSEPLLKFWTHNKFRPVYLRLKPSPLTGEHSCLMLCSVSAHASPADDWLAAYVADFRRRLTELLAFDFKMFPVATALQLLFTEPPAGAAGGCSSFELGMRDLVRLESFASALGDPHTILDIVPVLTRAWFQGSLVLALSPVQAAILLGVGLQHKSLEAIAKDLALPVSQLNALFNRALRKISDHLAQKNTQRITDMFPKPLPATLMAPRDTHLDDELDDDAKAFLDKLEAARQSISDKRLVPQDMRRPAKKKTPAQKKPHTYKKPRTA